MWGVNPCVQAHSMDIERGMGIKIHVAQTTRQACNGTIDEMAWKIKNHFHHPKRQLFFVTTCHHHRQVVPRHQTRIATFHIAAAGSIRARSHFESAHVLQMGTIADHLGHRYHSYNGIRYSTVHCCNDHAPGSRRAKMKLENFLTSGIKNG